jgi:DNA-binding NarL/FixJ family response regulator
MKKSETPVQVLIADSQFLITESLKMILQNDGCFLVCKVVTEKNDLIEALKINKISVLIIDPSQVDIAGFSELKEIKYGFPDLKILVITNSVTRKELHEFNSISINNIILKTEGKDEIIDALNATVNGKKHYSNELLDLLFESNEKKIIGEETGQLTGSELEIVRLIAEGLTTKEIAARKFISFHTVISHRKNIFRKLGVTSISELIMYSIKAGWINTIEYHI